MLRSNRKGRHLVFKLTEERPYVVHPPQLIQMRDRLSAERLASLGDDA